MLKALQVLPLHSDVAARVTKSTGYFLRGWFNISTLSGLSGRHFNCVRFQNATFIAVGAERVNKVSGSASVTIPEVHN